MYVSELRLYDFRQFKSVDGKPGLEVRFHPGLNALVGGERLGQDHGRRRDEVRASGRSFTSV